MKYPTLAVLPGEACYGLAEMPCVVEGKLRWVQRVFVLRDDAIAEWTHDYGPAEDFARVQALLIPSPEGENTVAELQYLAEKNRHDDYWTRRAEQMLAESTLIPDHLAQLERDQLAMRNRSTFGPAISVQRNGYSQERTRRIIKERTHR